MTFISPCLRSPCLKGHNLLNILLLKVNMSLDGVRASNTVMNVNLYFLSEFELCILTYLTVFARCAQGQHERKTEYGMCGIVTAVVCLSFVFCLKRYRFMVSCFVGPLPIWSYLPLVSPFSYHYLSHLTHSF